MQSSYECGAKQAQSDSSVSVAITACPAAVLSAAKYHTPMHSLTSQELSVIHLCIPSYPACVLLDLCQACPPDNAHDPQSCQAVMTTVT